jgi:hypothetical protein
VDSRARRLAGSAPVSKSSRAASILWQTPNDAYLEPMTVPAKKPPATAKVTRGRLGELEVRGEGNGRIRTLTYGSVSMNVRMAPSDRLDLDLNVGLGQAAMKKLKRKLVKPGVSLRTSKTTPKFYADPSNPRRLVRVLGDKREVGIFEGGTFKVLP